MISKLKDFFPLAPLTLLLIVSSAAVGQDTVFFTGFEYELEPIVIEPIDLNGAIDQIGLWSGLEFPPSQGQFPDDRVLFVEDRDDDG